MTAEPVPAGGDARRLLDDVKSLAHQVRVHQRLTWIALLILGLVTMVSIPFDYYGMIVHCVASGDGQACRFERRGMLLYWPPALLLAYAAIAVSYVRAARERGLGARVMPYVVTGVALVVAFLTSWVLFRVYLNGHPLPDPPHPMPWALLFLDRLISPWGTIGIALLVLARLERNLPLLGFTLVYLAVTLIPIDFGWHMNSDTRTVWIPQQVIDGMLLLLGSAGFAWVARRQR
ncbi:hypothetical protein ACWT_4651 [Actinoplanes sp. SE50]|uniref:hypothetical protein n=1 Tax=unclassified Actinoplanes TaxID=2626549 RepID=UPI00023EBBC4|nr:MULTISPECIES: hypothetical protein [unclassified Actinoplanes]AEV85673.1 hypothetical protein ACPL_4782 [Actinoplanes sp. SE50/110]ATO84066.1 hypothetical protein ACWT_4651 [Actinoplanes sp. SE50]SLM01476.1 hypothetical protein ACSP50_4712 [Actinoplanes sp. SE50/110]